MNAVEASGRSRRMFTGIIAAMRPQMYHRGMRLNEQLNGPSELSSATG